MSLKMSASLKYYYPESFLWRDFSLLCPGRICQKAYHFVNSKTYMWINILEISLLLHCFRYFPHLPYSDNFP